MFEGQCVYLECYLIGEQAMTYSYFTCQIKKVRKRFWSLVKVKAVYYHPAYLIYMQSTSCKMPGWMKHKLESRLPDADDTTLMAESEKELKSLLTKVKEESEKLT